MKSQVKYELFIGLLTSKGSTVTPAQVEEFKALFAERLNSCTLSYTTGIWNKVEEPAITLTHIGGIEELATIKELARIAKFKFKQDAVLIAVTQVSTLLIEDMPKFYNGTSLVFMDKDQLVKIAQEWGLSGAQRYKQAELICYIEEQQYQHQGTRTGAIGQGVGLK